MRSLIEVSVVIPAYNEERRVGPVLADVVTSLRLAGRTHEVIVVDDGSMDGTSRLVDDLSGQFPELRLIRLAENRGKGHAVRTGVANSRGELVLFADADGATPIGELSRLEAALAGGADIAIGSRALANADVKVNTRTYRRLIGRLFHFLVSSLTVGGFQDTQCGFKLFRRHAAHDLFSRMLMSGFSFDVEVLLMAERRGYRAVEVPVNWTHQPGSKVNLALDSLRMMRDLFIIRSNAMRGKYDRPRIAPMVDAAPGGLAAMATGQPETSPTR